MKLRSHWDNKYKSSPEKELGWYQESSEAFFKLLPLIEIEKEDIIFMAGAGSTHLVDELFASGFQHIIANDLSTYALNELIKRNDHSGLQVNDFNLTEEGSIQLKVKAKLWIDRAVLHFFHEDKAIQAYRTTILNNTAKGAYVMLAEFSETGAKVCNALPVKRYSIEDMKVFLGNDFDLIHHFDYDYINPKGGIRPYNYALFKRGL